MMDLRFEQSWVLWLLGAWLLLWPLRAHWRKRTDAALLAWLGSRPLGPLLRRNERGIPLRRTAKDLAIAFVLFAAASPSVAGTSLERLAPQDLLILLDVSRSMLAEDLSPSRLAAAKSAVQSLIASLEQTRLGLIVFAGEPVLRLPQSRDRSAFAEILAASDSLDVPRGGTDLAAALARSAQAFSKGAKIARSVLLVTDGKDEGGRAAAVARELSAEGIAVFVWGIGTRYGAEIPITDALGRPDWVRDANKDPVRVRLEMESLRAIAIAGGGESFSLESEGAKERTEAALEGRQLLLAREAAAEDPAARRPLYGYALIAAFVSGGLCLAGFERRRARA